MKNFSTLLFTVTVGIASLAGCASPPYAQQTTPMGGMSMSDGKMKSMSDGDMKSMCDKHMKMMGSMSPADQKAMMDSKMKDMSPEMREKHMQEMAMCK
jgi:hypothetical protein